VRDVRGTSIFPPLPPAHPTEPESWDVSRTQGSRRKGFGGEAGFPEASDNSQVSGDLFNPSPMPFCLQGQRPLLVLKPVRLNPCRSVSDWCEGGFGERGMSSSEDLSREP
jgi:hypothetical protein